MKNIIWKGSYTVEASFLMVVIISVLTALIYTGFFLHDMAYLKAAAYETALAGSLCGEGDKRMAVMEEKKTEFLQGRLMGTKSVAGDISVQGEEIRVRFQGEFTMPGLSGEIGKNLFGRIRKQCSIKIIDPRKTVNKIHGIKKILKE